MKILRSDATSTPLEGLRRATRDLHARLHGHTAFAPLVQNPPDAAGYARLLGQLRGFHAPTEAALFDDAARLLPELDDLAQRRKAHFLDGDIVALEKIFPHFEKHSSAGFVPPTNLSRPDLLGCLYVTEGATLGGRELGRKLGPVLRSLGLGGEAGTRFFMAYGRRQGEMWRRFCGVLASVAGDFTAEERGSMEFASQTMFLSMESWLAQSHLDR